MSKIDIKTVILGDTSTGKTALRTRMTTNEFNPNLPSTIIDLAQLTLESNVDQGQICLCIHDTAGQERYASITTQYLRAVRLCFLVYDITNHATFEHILKWQELASNESSAVEFILIGAKSDLVKEDEEARKVTVQESEALKDTIPGCLAFLETSSKTGAGIAELTDLIINHTFPVGATVEAPAALQPAQSKGCC